MPTYTAPTTRTTGELISAAIFNTDLVENIKYFKDSPAFAGNVTVGGTLGVTGATTLSSTVATGALTITGAATYTTSLKSTTALATPGALSATQATEFASTVSGASLMGFGTTNDVSLMNRAGTVVLGVGPNTTAVNIPGTLAVTGAVTGGTYNGQTISSVASFTGTVGVAGLLTVAANGTSTFGGASSAAGENMLRMQNTTGTGNAKIDAFADASNRIFITAFGTSFATSGPNIAASGLLGTDATDGLSIGALNASGVIRFYSGGTTERMRLLTAGVLGIGTTSAYQEGARTGLISAGFSFASSWGMYLNETASTSGAGFIIFGLGPGTGSSGIGSITRNGSTSAVLYNLTSDSRLKHDRGLAIDLSGLRALRVHDFTWINDPTQALDRNVFAQEAYTAIGRGITPGDDDLVTITKPWMVDRTSFIPDLIVGWQQHDATISQLAARIAALESQDN